MKLRPTDEELAYFSPAFFPKIVPGVERTGQQARSVVVPSGIVRQKRGRGDIPQKPPFLQCGNEVFSQRKNRERDVGGRVGILCNNNVRPIPGVFFRVKNDCSFGAPS